MDDLSLVGVLVVGDFQRGQYTPLVASRLRIAQIVHHSVEGAAHFVGNVLGTNADKITKVTEANREGKKLIRGQWVLRESRGVDRG
jgi:hypothetical protein